MVRWRFLIALLVAALALSSSPQSERRALAQAGCKYSYKFQALQVQIPQIVGGCVEDEYQNPDNGNVEQHTTGGLVYWRFVDRRVLFTDGSTTWIITPEGLQRRPNNQTFDWELVDPNPAVQVEPPLYDAWNTLFAIQREIGPGKPLGAVVQGIAWRTGVPMRVRPLPTGVLGGYSRRDKTITLSEGMLSEDPRAVAAVLAHELIHAQQDWEGRISDDTCVLVEVEAHASGAIVWAEFWPDERYPTRTPVERTLTEVTRRWVVESEPGMYRLVVENPAYQDQCKIQAPVAPPPGLAPPPRPSGSAPAPKPSRSANLQQLQARCLRSTNSLMSAMERSGWASKDAAPVRDAFKNLCERAAERDGSVGVECAESIMVRWFRDELHPQQFASAYRQCIGE